MMIVVVFYVGYVREFRVLATHFVGHDVPSSSRQHFIFHLGAFFKFSLLQVATSCPITSSSARYIGIYTVSPSVPLLLHPRRLR